MSILSSWQLNGTCLPKATLETHGVLKREAPTVPCPRCQAPAESEEFLSTATDPPRRRRLIRCPNAKGKNPTCKHTLIDLEETVPTISPEMKERIVILTNKGITRKQIADRAGYTPATFNTYMGGRGSLAEAKIEQAVAELEQSGPAAAQSEEPKIEAPRRAKRTPAPREKWIPAPPPSDSETFLQVLVSSLLQLTAEARLELLDLVEKIERVNQQRERVAKLFQQ